jgi:UDP-N-acetylglucosamine--N-acetylmuramyl-(pentapeptide) pyrophosphoryl-undecaprenol N-acetylglucosamine transferase
VGFSEAASRLKNRNTTVTGTPVRAGFVPTDPAAARIALGFRPDQPLLVVIGGSQGAEGVNRLVVQSLPALLEAMPDLQVFHVTGTRDFESVTTAFASFGDQVRVTPFHQGMDVALAAATVAVSRSGASSLAEFAAMRVPAILIPFPAATDDHQRVNAQAMVKVGASRMLEQRTASVSDLVHSVRELITDEAVRLTMIQSLSALDAPGAAGRIAEQILSQSGVLASAPASHRSGESRSNRRSVSVGVDVTRTRETLA